MIILHGDNTVASRERLNQLVDEAKSKNHTITRLEAKKLTPAHLEIALQPLNLFGQDTMVIVEELHSLPTSKRKKELIALLAESDQHSILWEKRALTKTMLKNFPGATEQSFPVSKAIFKWLDSLGSPDPAKTITLFRQAVEQDSGHFCFMMLSRQIRLLIQVADGDTPPGAPFMIKKLKGQASKFSLQQLLALHTALYTLDKKMKKSELLLPMEAELELLFLK